MSENLNTSNIENDNPIATPAPVASEDNSSRILKHEKHLIEMRRARVLELWSQGWSQPRIAAEVHVVQSTIHEDISFLKQQAREQIKNFVTSELPNTVAKARVTLDLITQKLWATVAQAERDGDEKTKMSVLSAIQSAEMQKIEIVSNLGIVDQVTTAADQKQRAVIPTPLPTPEEEQAIADEYIRDTKYSEKEEDPAPATRARAIPVDDSGED